MRHLRVVVTGLLIAGSAVLAACSGGTAATPSAPEPQTAITARVLGQLLDQHDPGSYAIAPSDAPVAGSEPTEFISGLSATAYYRATPGRAARTLTLSYAPARYAGTFDCAEPTCIRRDGVLVRERSHEVISVREVGFVRVSGSPSNFEGDALDAVIALARDATIAPTVGQSLAHAAAANPRWRSDALDCGDASPSAPIALPAAAGAVRAVTPQALAAVLASHLAASCAGDDSRSDTIIGTVYLGSDTERVSLTIAATPYRCPQLDTCRTVNGLTVAEQHDVAELTYPAHLVVARQLPDGTHWLIADEASVRAHNGRFPVDLSGLTQVVNDPRVGAGVDAALISAGDDLPLRWRLAPRTSE